ncbi:MULTISPECIES: MDR family MFS transporter [unclassified Arthrobacter]|uniref:MDR family MFS transporter n=1 Tax=unclassified Arthrobacter TaxID=235627 RepID=UPI00159D8D78|nr:MULTISPECIES: MDR family MFS transporter [unclassified Arthrobacter]MCQ9162602.1 MFS transporter [Arthrobacter sp. STN4]NVM97415.1 MFS transporter [Arthrobacter sp. SDTb3-6]
MTHRQVIQSLTGLLMGMFVSILAGTVVSTSLPVILSDLHGDQTAYTWVVTATLLATTISTPIWGKLADLSNRKVLLQLALVVFVVASAIAGFSQDTSMLITMRVFQGLGAGGLTALSQIVMADIISPRERGKYMGLFGAVMALGTVGGPLIGGFITDAINWRWNFFVALPFAAIAIILIQKTLHLPVQAKRKVSIDYAGIVLLSAGVSLLLVWVSLAGTQFDWASTTTALMVGGAAAALVAFVIVELKASEPIIPLAMFRNRTFTLSVVASISVGVSMFGTSVFLAQYMQLARGANATQSGLMTIPMMAGLLIVSTIAGALISKFGKWKMVMVLGSVLQLAGLFMLGTIHYDTNFVLVSLYMFVLGAGLGMVMQNLVLIVQNAVTPAEIGVASSGIAFFRSLGGTIGVSVLGALMATKVVDVLGGKAAELQAAIAALGAQGKALGAALAGGSIPAVHSLPDSVRSIIESSYGDSVAFVFMIAAPLSILTILAIVFLPNLELSSQTRDQREKSDAAATGILDLESAEQNLADVSEALVAVAPGTATGNLPVVRR